MYKVRINKKLFLLLTSVIVGLGIFFLSTKFGENILPSKTTVSGIKKGVLQSQTAYAAVDVTKYTQSPYNLPTPGEPEELSSEAITIANSVGSHVASFQTYLTSKHDAQLVDPFLSAIWAAAIEGITSPYFWNCNDNDSITVNDGCAGNFSSGNWQVGFGIQVSQAANHIVEDFNAAYGDGKADDATFVGGIGQAVLDSGSISNPSTFPNKKLSEISAAAINGDSASQQALAVLLMDQKLGAIAVAREIASDIAGNGSWRGAMEGWDSPPDSTYYTDNMQKFSNRMAYLAQHYTGVSGTVPGGGVGGGSFTLSLVLKPTKDDVYVTNIATAYAIGGTGGTGSSSATTNGPVNPDATCPGEGPITCGTRAGSAQASACHCTASYEENVTGCNGYCSWCHPPDDGAVYAIDIANPLDAPVFIPKISVGGEVRTVTCIGYGNQTGSTEPNQIIQILSCSDDKTDEAVWMQFHHSKKSNPVTEGKTYKSGETVGYSAEMEVFASDPHVHYQIGVSGPCGAGGTASCRNADEFVQCN